MEREIDPLQRAEMETAEMMVRFAKSDRVRLNPEEVQKVESCFEIAGCNKSNFPSLSKRVECWSILLHCIRPCDRYELGLIQSRLLELAGHEE